MPDQLFQKLLDETADTRWQTFDDLRGRALRRRRTRVALVATAAVVTIAAATGGVAATRPDGAPPPGPGSSPSVQPPSTDPTPSNPPTTPPPTRATPSRTGGDAAPIGDLFLRPADVGPGYRTNSGGISGGDWTFEFSASALRCAETGPPVRAAESTDRFLSRGAPEAGDRLGERISRYGEGDAARAMARVRERVAACAPAGGQSITVTDRDFAGQEALLVAVDHGGGYRTNHVLVRQGDLVAELFVKPAWDRAALRGLGRVAAARLCGGTPAC